jgi:alcohol dehydrogenase class IV
MPALSQTMLIVYLITFNKAEVPESIKEVAKELITEAYSVQDSDTIVAHIRRLVIKLGVQIDKVEEGSNNGTSEHIS